MPPVIISQCFPFFFSEFSHHFVLCDIMNPRVLLLKIERDRALRGRVFIWLEAIQSISRLVHFQSGVLKCCKNALRDHCVVHLHFLKRVLPEIAGESRKSLENGVDLLLHLCWASSCSSFANIAKINCFDNRSVNDNNCFFLASSRLRFVAPSLFGFSFFSYSQKLDRALYFCGSHNKLAFRELFTL